MPNMEYVNILDGTDILLRLIVELKGSDAYEDLCEVLSRISDFSEEFSDWIQKGEMENTAIMEFPMRTKKEIVEAAKEYDDRVWYHRHTMLKYRIEHDGEYCGPEIPTRARAAAKQKEKKYGKKNLTPLTDFELGMINGKLSAIRWVLGDEWDSLDT